MYTPICKYYVCMDNDFAHLFVQNMRVHDVQVKFIYKNKIQGQNEAVLDKAHVPILTPQHSFRIPGMTD